MDVITRITKERGRYRVTVSSSDEFLVPSTLMRERPLHEGQELDIEEYDNWLMIRQYRHALDRAVAYLAARARSKREVTQKLLQAGYRPCTVEMVIYKLERENILDDADFARQWVEARSASKLGKNRIAMELRRKGITSVEAEEAMADIDDDEQLEAAITLAKKAYARSKRDEDPRKAAQRISAMLARRGYGWDIVKSAVQAAIQDAPDDEN